MKKILVVDDNPDILEAIQMILETQGYNVATTTQSSQAFAKINQTLPDLVILDVLLSGSDGRTICRALKDKDSTRKVPVLLISAHPSAEASIKHCGADAFIAKPFGVEKILKTVKALLDLNEQTVPENSRYKNGDRYRD